MIYVWVTQTASGVALPTTTASRATKAGPFEVTSGTSTIRLVAVRGRRMPVTPDSGSYRRMDDGITETLPRGLAGRPGDGYPIPVRYSLQGRNVPCRCGRTGYRVIPRRG